MTEKERFRRPANVFSSRVHAGDHVAIRSLLSTCVATIGAGLHHQPCAQQIEQSGPWIFDEQGLIVACACPHVRLPFVVRFVMAALRCSPANPETTPARRATISAQIARRCPPRC